MTDATVRVFVADDHPLVLDGIKALVLADPGLTLIGEARDGPMALQRSIELQPDVLVLDISMPRLNGIEVARRFIEACPQSRVLVLTVHEDGAYLRQLLDLGVAGYVLKRSASDELRRAIHAIAKGGIYLDPAIAARAIGRPIAPPHNGSDSVDAVELSPRELDVLRLTAIGHSNKSIANTLQIGVKSVDTYKARAMGKLRFRSRIEVVRFALAKGWLSDP